MKAKTKEWVLSFLAGFLATVLGIIFGILSALLLKTERTSFPVLPGRKAAMTADIQKKVRITCLTPAYSFRLRIR